MKKLIKKIIKLILSPTKPLVRYSVNLNRNYLIKKKLINKKINLELMGGNYPIYDSYINIDLLQSPEVDLIHKFPEKMPFKENSINEILSIAAFEHFSLKDSISIIKDCHRILKKNGILYICVPTLDKIFKKYTEEGCTDELLRYLFGAQKDKYDIHLSILSEKRLINELIKIGFKKVTIEPYNLKKHSKDYISKFKAIK